MLDLHRIAQSTIEQMPYRWAFIDRLFSPEDANRLAATFPSDKFKRVEGYDGEKSYVYMSRSLIHMGAALPSHAESLSPAWQELARDLLSPEYRSALRKITGKDVTTSPMEVNVIHYGRGAFMGPHIDLKQKMMTHVLYFNETWDQESGGCVNILGSSDPFDVIARIPPVVGNSVLLVRSKKILALCLSGHGGLSDFPAQHQCHSPPARLCQHHVAAPRSSYASGLRLRRLSCERPGLLGSSTTSC